MREMILSNRQLAVFEDYKSGALTKEGAMSDLMRLGMPHVEVMDLLEGRARPVRK